MLRAPSPRSSLYLFQGKRMVIWLKIPKCMTFRFYKMASNFSGCHLLCLTLDHMQIVMFFPSMWGHPSVVSLDLTACSEKWKAYPVGNIIQPCSVPLSKFCDYQWCSASKPCRNVWKILCKFNLFWFWGYKYLFIAQIVCGGGEKKEEYFKSYIEKRSWCDLQ